MGIAFKGFTPSIVNEPQRRPLLLANRIHFIEAPTLSRWPSSPSGWDSPQGVPPPLYSEWDSLQGGPLLFLQGILFSKWMRFSSRGFPLHSEWDSLQGSHPLQENGIRTKRVTLSKANGIRIKRVTLSKANEIRFKGVPLSIADGIRIKKVTLSKANGIRF